MSQLLLGHLRAGDDQRVADQYHVKFVGWFNTTHYNGDVPADYQLRVLNRKNPPHEIISDPTTLDITEPGPCGGRPNRSSTT